jgi:hypothetical protein
MPSTYDISASAMLSDAAADLDPDALDAHTLLAEHLLGLAGDAYTGDDLDTVDIALALQVNHQVERGVDADVYESVDHGGRTLQYAAGVTVSPQAAAIAAALLGPPPGTGWATLHSIR